MNAHRVFMSYLVFSILCLLSVTGYSGRSSVANLTPEIHQYSANDMNGNRFGPGLKCSEDDVTLVQGSSAPLPSGIPTYTVHISNTCVTGCSISNIHVKCGWFSSAVLIDPNIFKRISYDDCLVNGGKPLGAAETILFQYAQTRSYPLSVATAAVNC